MCVCLLASKHALLSFVHAINAGAYYDAANQPAKFCSLPPKMVWARNSTAGWPVECARVLVGTVCVAACGANATGVDYTARCDDSDLWTFLGGGCTSELVPAQHLECSMQG